ncbi:MAG: glycosyltransferase family 2 protein [Myxococcales bacterium]|nr:glycosyltransferase family 2 protein [Myxococcales bacterium]
MNPSTELAEAGGGALKPARSFASLSIVIPTYNEVESLEALVKELHEELPKSGVPYELLFVDDGSRDGTDELMAKICADDKRVRYVRLRRNFGKAAALSEGFERATGEVVVTMDADLQDVPGEVEKLLAKLDDGYDLVSGWKWPRKDPIGKRWPSKVFNWAVRKGAGVPLHDVNCGLKAYRADMLRQLHLYGDMHRYIPVMAQAQGFRVTESKVHHRSRQFGYSKYSVGRYSRGLLDFLTVMFLTRYRNRPLHLIGGFGLILGFIGTFILLILSVMWVAGTPIGGRPLFFLGITMLIVAVQLVSFGLLAEMVTSFFLERQNRYPVVQELGFEDPDDA